MPDVRHVECLGALHGEHVAGVVEVFGAAPAKFLDDDVFRRGKPGFALEEVLRRRPEEDAYFYAVHSGSEIDLFFPDTGIGVEVKFQDVPRLTRSMRIPMEDLELKELLVVYPGKREFELAEGVRAVPLAMMFGGDLGD